LFLVVTKSLIIAGVHARWSWLAGMDHDRPASWLEPVGVQVGLSIAR